MSYINDDFLLDTKTAQTLYNDWAKDMPIIDYHNHLPPEQVAGDYQFTDLADAWLAGDHYKWRAMRANGVDESLCTGDAPPREKFQAWAETVPKLLRNQLYPWTQLELKRIFGIEELLNGDAAEAIWTTCNEKLASPEFSARGLLKQSNVKVVCTTDDPIHTLEHHISMAQEGDDSLKMYPAWRPDKGMAIDKPELFNAWLDDLADPRPLAAWSEAWSNQAGLARRHNTLAFLQALHLLATAAGDEQGSQLAAQVMDALRLIKN